MEILNTIMLVFAAIVVVAFVVFLLTLAHKNSDEREKMDAVRIKNEAKRFADSKNNYFDTLSKLKDEPNNPELKQLTLKKVENFLLYRENTKGKIKP